jgi:hypothetical protein
MANFFGMTTLTHYEEKTMQPLRRVIPIYSLVLGALFLSSNLLSNPQQKPLLSPRDSTILYLQGKKLVVDYGRPSMRGRTIMGELVPWNKVWRTGANEATTFRIDTGLVIGPDVPLQRGAYTLWTLPSENDWKLIINKETGQWGTKYRESQDYARFDMKMEKLEKPVEKFTIDLEKTGNASGLLKMMWENTLISTPFMINEKRIPPSPRDSVTLALGTAKISVNYGRPFMRGRRIMGNVVPYDSVWRTGASAATALTTDADLAIGGVSLPKGTYSLWTLPSEKGWKLIISKKVGRGAAQYDQKEDFARIDMKEESLNNPIEQLTISLEGVGADTGVLKLAWENTQVSVDFKVQ